MEAFELRLWDGRLGRWQSPDPYAEFHSPYLGMGNNPIGLTDPDGGSTEPPNDYVFDEKGNYVRTDITNKPDRIIIENSITCERTSYAFADPINDPKQIDGGLINKVVFVSRNDITNMLKEQGAFDQNNITKFIEKSTTDFDYSYRVLPDIYSKQGAKKRPLYDPPSLLFIPRGDGYAHNQMNFGNFLWAASGYTLGHSKGFLTQGAHLNSLFGRKNGYSGQFDSDDDQLSISRGTNYARKFNFRKKAIPRAYPDMPKDSRYGLF